MACTTQATVFGEKPRQESRQIPGDRNRGRNHRRMFCVELSPLACSACFHIQPRTKHRRMALLPVSRDLPHQLLIKKCAAYLPMFYEVIFSTKTPSYQIWLCLCPVDNSKHRPITAIVHSLPGIACAMSLFYADLVPCE